MRTQTITKNIFKFDELDERTQGKALDGLYGINVDYDWWDSVYADAATIGLKLKYFDLDRNRHATGSFTESPLTVIRLIKENHGKDCETFKTADGFEQTFLDYQTAEAYDDEHLDDEDFEQRFDGYALEDSTKEFLDSLLEDYATMLQKEYEYLTSREAILETIEANDYEFDENGKLTRQSYHRHQFNRWCLLIGLLTTGLRKEDDMTNKQAETLIGKSITVRGRIDGKTYQIKLLKRWIGTVYFIAENVFGDAQITKQPLFNVYPVDLAQTNYRLRNQRLDRRKKERGFYETHN